MSLFINKYQTEIYRYTYNTQAYYYYSDVWKQGVFREMEQIPLTNEKAFRGLKTSRLLNEIEGDIWKPKGICSCSRDLNTAKEFAFAKKKSGQKISIVCILGRGKYIAPLSHHPEEQEVLFKEGDTFKIHLDREWNGIQIWIAKQI